MKGVYGLQFTSYAIELCSLYSYKGFGIGLDTGDAIGCQNKGCIGAAYVNLEEHYWSNEWCC